MTVSVAATSGPDQQMDVWMPVKRPSPGVEHPEEGTVHFPVVALESLEGFRNGGKQQVSGKPVVAGEEIAESLGHREDHMEMGAVGKAFADLFRPLRLTRTEAVRAMTVTAGTRIPFGVMALAALGTVESQFAVTTVGHEIES